MKTRALLETAGGTDGQRHAPFAPAAPPGDRAIGLRLARGLGAIALLVVGGIHLEQYAVVHYSVIPTIGPLFLLNFISATILGVALLVPVRGALRPRRLSFDWLAALAGISVSAGALVALLISERTPLFGFMEHGYRLEIVIAIVSEAAAIVSLSVFLGCAYARLRPSRGRPVVSATPEGSIRAMPGGPATEGAADLRSRMS